MPQPWARSGILSTSYAVAVTKPYQAVPLCLKMKTSTVRSAMRIRLPRLALNAKVQLLG